MSVSTDSENPFENHNLKSQNMTKLANSTKTIAGHRLTLFEGVRYIASRPMADRGTKRFPVTVQPMVGAPPEATEIRIDDLTYDEANELLAAFNNGAMSFDGRVW